MDEKDKKEITSWIEESFQDGNLNDLKIELMGTNAKGEGYGGEFIFAKVTGTNKDNQFEEVHVAIKMGKKGNVPGDNLPMLRECYKRELFFYDKVLPAFRKFQLDRKIVNTFDAVPKCYKTISTAEREVIVMENLKKKGYTLHDKRKPMNSKHLRLVLKNYAKFHALSFAMKDQDKEEYQN
ncbi:hypothetical protein JTB14_037588 [Gonioctena quinquepunctata]|nr:hypothetical protein JTB14_037588 [Gonioctena quinquepunctata]